MYAFVRNLATLQMNDQDLSEYLTPAQSTINGLKRMMALTNITIPTVEELIDRLVWVSLPSDDTHTTPESSDFVSKFSNGGRDGRGRGRGRGRGGKSNFYCTHCRKDGHTQDRCFDLHGYPNKTANVAQTTTNHESKGELETTFCVDEYQEYFRLKATQQATSSTTIAHTGNSMSSLPVVIDESPPLLNRYGITYERRLRPHDSALIPSASTPAPAPSPDLPIVIHKVVTALASVSIPKTIQEALSHPG
ncbi:hypothetical protein KIW84_063571 [Lathyrus oleraceus]|uniref:Uncharacterized protein n=1 Tax=Pisum sativum TaxID=3888 RepID=A0A9D4W9W2_PEA|nr:hypothetical protein KIW84_063571 [Pisum sativum]